MLFTETLEALQNGKIVSRDAWDKTAEYLVLMPGVPYIWKILTQPAPNVGNWTPPFAEIMATDWKVIDKLPSQETVDPA